MKWPWQTPRRDWTVTDTGGQKAREAAERDLEQAEAALEQTRAETPKYAALGRDLREIRQRNHLAMAFLEAAGGRQRP